MLPLLVRDGKRPTLPLRQSERARGDPHLGKLVEVMNAAWAQSAKARPTFVQIAYRLADIQHAAASEDERASNDKEQGL